MDQGSYDAAVSELQAGSQETPEEVQGETAVQEEETPQTQEEMLEFLLGENKFNVPLSYQIPIKHNGEVRDVPLGSVINSWRQNSQLQTKQAEYKQQLGDYESKFNALGENYDKILEFQKWSESNPEQWERLWTALNEKEKYTLASGNESSDNGLSPDHPLLGHVSELTQKLQSMEDKLGHYEKLEQEAENQQIVAQVNEEIDAFGKEFPHIDLTQIDDEGISLKGQILKFGADNGYPTFRSAAIDYKYQDGSTLLEKLKESALSQGRNDAVKTIKQDKKNGILERSAVPSFGQDKKVDLSRLSEEDRIDAALAELKGSFQGF